MASHSNWPDILLAQAVKTRSNRAAHESCNRQESSLIALQKCQAKSLAAGVAYYCSQSLKTPSVISLALPFPLSFQGLAWWLSGLRVCQRFVPLVWREQVQCSNRRRTWAEWKGFRPRGGIIGALWCTGALKCSLGALSDSLLTLQTRLATCDHGRQDWAVRGNLSLVPLSTVLVSILRGLLMVPFTLYAFSHSSLRGANCYGRSCYCAVIVIYQPDSVCLAASASLRLLQ